MDVVISMKFRCAGPIHKVLLLNAGYILEVQNGYVTM
jgi:hypothetical protein